MRRRAILNRPRWRTYRPPITSSAAFYDDFYEFGGISLAGRLPRKRPTTSSETWDVVQGTLTMSNGKLVGGHASVNTAITVMDYGEDDADIRIEFEFSASGSNRTAAVILRYLDNSNFWMAQADLSNGTFRIIQVITTQNNRATSTYTFSTGVRYSIRATCNESDFTATLNTVSGGVDTPVTLNSGVLNPLTHTAVTPDTGRTNHGLRVTNTVGSPGTMVYRFEGDPSPEPADSTITVAGSSSVTSRMETAVSFIANNPRVWTSAGWDNVKTSLSTMVSAIKTHIYPFGMSDPWITQGDASPGSLWSTGTNHLSAALAAIAEVDAGMKVILTPYGFPWWMKANCNSNGTTTLFNSTQASTADGRVMSNYMTKCLEYVDKAVRMAAAAGCRDFDGGGLQELKGYYFNPEGESRRWDMSMNPGTANTANMGASYFYQQVSNQIVTTMTALAVAREDYRISGPYIVAAMRGAQSADAIPNTHVLWPYVGVFGYPNKMPLNALDTFLENAEANSFELDVLSVDMSTYLQDGVYPSSDPFQYNEKFTVMTDYFRDRLEAYGFDRDLPIDYSEIYSFPPTALQTAGNTTLRAALWADCLARCAYNRVRYPMVWGVSGESQGASNTAEGGLVSDPDTIAENGTVLLVGTIVKYFHDNFGPDTALYEVTCSDSRLGGIASATKLLVYNKTSSELDVDVEGSIVSFAAYETKLLDR